MIDMAIRFVGNIDLIWLQRSQQFNQIAQDRAALISSRLTVHGSVVILLDRRIGLVFLCELLLDYLAVCALVQVAQVAVRIAQHDEVIGFSTQNPKCGAALDLAEARKRYEIVGTDLIARLMGDASCPVGEANPAGDRNNLPSRTAGQRLHDNPAQPMTSSSGCGAKTTIDSGRVDWD